MPRVWCGALAALVLDAVLAQTGCPSGQGTNGVGLPDVCTDCPAGRQSHAGGVTCVDCAELTVPNEDQTGCICEAAANVLCDGGCSPGQECAMNQTSGVAECMQCPEGKQSQGGMTPCSYCRFTLRPTAAQDGCECAELHYNMQASSSALMDSGCTPCSAVPVRFMGEKEPRSCQTSGALRACGEEQTESGLDITDGRSRCDNSGAQCECSGGAKGNASLCARDGFYVIENQAAEPGASLSLIQCVALRGRRSRCKHWSKCLGRQADIRWSDDDPYGKWDDSLPGVVTGANGYSLMEGPPNTPVAEDGTEDGLHYIDDFEFAVWLNTPAGRDARCPHAQECCTPGFTGKLCDNCSDADSMKIGGSCVQCDSAEMVGNAVQGLAMSFGFTLFIMHKASATFQDADGTIAIAIFYFQIVALLFKDRAADFGWFLVGLVNFMELGFLRNTPTSCVVHLTFYENFYFSIFSTLIVVGLSYGILVALCVLTSREKRESREIKDALEETKFNKILEHLLRHIPLFEACSGAELDAVADGMVHHKNLHKNHVLKQHSDPKGIFVVVVKGSVKVEHVSGRRKKGDLLGVYTQGHHYGEGALFSHGSKHIRISAAEKHTSVMVLTKAKFMKLKVDGRLICETVINKAYQVEQAQDNELLESGMKAYDDDGNSSLSYEEAGRWLRARRFDPSPQFLQALFARFDANGDGQISKDEFRTVLRETDTLEDHFNHFDLNDSGTIDTSEFGALMESCGQKLTKAERSKLVNELDSNNSGDIDFDEFCEMMLERELDIQRESLDNHYDPKIHADVEGGQDALNGFRGIRRYVESEQQKEEEAIMNTEAVIEREEFVERVVQHSFKTVHQKRELAVEVEVTNKCCLRIHALMKAANMELMNIYVACSDSTARKCAVLEATIALYGPLSLVAMSVLFCWEVDGEQVLVVDSLQKCSTTEYFVAKWFAWAFLALLTIGCPLAMWYAAVTFYAAVGDDHVHNSHAKDLAKSRYHSAWSTMNKKEKDKVIEQCAHELRLELMGAHSFLLTSFQMSVTRHVANWYPQWHLVRRTILNYLYFEGMRAGGEIELVGDFRADWRVLVVVVLAISNLLQTFFRVFRDNQEDRLEMWALHFLLVVVVIDVANEEISLYLCLLLSAIFATMVASDMLSDKKNEGVSKQQWTKVRKLALLGDSSGDNLKQAEQKGELTNQVIKAKRAIEKSEERPEALDRKKFTNPLLMRADVNSDASSDEDTPTPTSGARNQVQLIKASVRMGAPMHKPAEDGNAAGTMHTLE